MHGTLVKRSNPTILCYTSKKPIHPTCQFLPSKKPYTPGCHRAMLLQSRQRSTHHHRWRVSAMDWCSLLVPGDPWNQKTALKILACRMSSCWNSCVTFGSERCKRKELALWLLISTKNSCFPFKGINYSLFSLHTCGLYGNQNKYGWKPRAGLSELTRRLKLLVIGSFTLQKNTQMLFSNNWVPQERHKGFNQPSLPPICLSLGWIQHQLLQGLPHWIPVLDNLQMIDV